MAQTSESVGGFDVSALVLTFEKINVDPRTIMMKYITMVLKRAKNRMSNHFYGCNICN
jgi:hypothetical protein